VQLRRASDDAVLEIGDDDGTVAGAFGGVALQEAIIHEAVETVVAALGIKPQQVIAQQGQLFVLPKRSNGAPGGVQKGNVLIAHAILLSVALEEASNP